jgi:hypothetical protein
MTIERERGHKKDDIILTSGICEHVHRRGELSVCPDDPGRLLFRGAGFALQEGTPAEEVPGD